MVLNRVTVWPGFRVPLPSVLLFETRTKDDIWLVSKGVGSVPQRVPVPSDLYLHEVADLDTDDSSAVCSFANEHGWLGTWSYQVAQGLPDHDRALCQATKEINRAEPEAHPEKGSAILVERLANVVEAVHVVRDLTRLSFGLTGAMPVEEAVAVCESETLTHPGSLWALSRHDEKSARSNAELAVERILDDALAPFHVSVRFSPLDEDAFGELHDLFSVLCLSLANDIADQADYKRCASETCGRLFTRHRGRAKQGKYHMTGVKFCSVECARAQKQREYRRRQKAEKQRRQRPAGQEEASRALRDDKEGQ